MEITQPLKNQESGFAMVMALIILPVLMYSLHQFIYLHHHWRKKVHIQYALDRCVAKQADQVEAIYEQVEQIRVTMTALRAASIPARAFPPTYTAIQNALRALSLVFLGIKSHWALIATWNKGSCKDIGGGRYLSMKFKWESGHPDAIGPVAPRWVGNKKKSTKIQADFAGLSSSAVVIANSQSIENLEWTPKWTQPTLFPHWIRISND